MGSKKLDVVSQIKKEHEEKSNQLFRLKTFILNEICYVHEIIQIFILESCNICTDFKFISVSSAFLSNKF